LLADVQWLAHGEDLPLDIEQADLLALLATLAEHPLVAGLGLDGTVSGQQALANQLAYLLPFSLEQKLALLALPQPGEQLALIQSLLDRLQGEMLA
jgi:Lon protease-like protein